jgi:hypothetical protein
MSKITIATRLTLHNEHGEYSVQVCKKEMTLTEIFEELIIPVLHASGYDSQTVADFFR